MSSEYYLRLVFTTKCVNDSFGIVEVSYCEMALKEEEMEVMMHLFQVVAQLYIRPNLSIKYFINIANYHCIQSSYNLMFNFVVKVDLMNSFALVYIYLFIYLYSQLLFSSRYFLSYLSIIEFVIS